MAVVAWIDSYERIIQVMEFREGQTRLQDLLIHSMAELGDLILSSLSIAKAEAVVEIGAEYGGMSTLLAKFVNRAEGSLVCIDPCPKPEFLSWVEAEPRVRHDARPSLEALCDIKAADAWLIDGDHNWYTVYHELKAIDGICRDQEQPLLIFLHDVGWPCARRDQYYEPSRIPQEYRHEFSFDAGAIPGRSRLVPNSGFRGMGAFAYAVEEGGPRNGVMTAVDDFLREMLADGQEVAFAEVPAVFGLGVLFAMDASWSERLANELMPFHQNSLLARLEENRLLNYLKVIEAQDRS